MPDIPDIAQYDVFTLNPPITRWIVPATSHDDAAQAVLDLFPTTLTRDELGTIRITAGRVAQLSVRIDITEPIKEK